jgi:hydroxypyruvate isomerase
MLFTELPLTERFAAARAAGFGAVEIQMPYDEPAATLAVAREAAGLPVALLNTPLGDFAAGERGLAALPGREADFESAFDRAMAYAMALDCGMMHVVAGIPPEGTDPGATDAVLLRNLRHGLAASRVTGLLLLLEPLNHRDFPGCHITSVDHARRLIEAVGDTRLGLQYDLYHRQMSRGDLENGLVENFDIIRHMQIAGAPKRNEPDVGEINYRHLFGVIDGLGYDGWIGAEYNPVGDTVAGLGWMERLTPA